MIARNSKSRVINLDHYRWMVLIGMPISLALLAFLIITDSTEILLSDWFFDFITIPAFVGNIISGSTYLARSIPRRPFAGLAEQVGTTAGAVLGIISGIVVSIIDVVPFGKSLKSVANTIFTLGQVSNFSGLGNRLGSAVGNSRPKTERRAMSAAAFVGLALGIVLFATATTAMVSVMGFTTIFTAGAAVPIWAAGILFVTNFSSSFASCADYTSKAHSFLKANQTKDNDLKKTVSEKFHEYRGSFFGSITGALIGGIIVAVLAITQPHVFVGIIGVIAAAVFITTSISIVGGLFSRVGRLMDGFKNKIESKKAPLEQPSDAPSCQPENNPHQSEKSPRSSMAQTIKKMTESPVERKDNAKVKHEEPIMNKHVRIGRDACSVAVLAARTMIRNIRITEQRHHDLNSTLTVPEIS